MSDSQNLLINVICPHCNKHLVVAISGFAGELSSRIKPCKFCGQEYHVHLLAQTSKVESPSDGEISGMRDRIKYLKSERKLTSAQLLIKVELFQRLNNEALEMAREQRRNFQNN